MENTYQETTITNSLDDDYLSDKSNKLSSFKQKILTEDIIQKYKDNYPSLKHVRCDEYNKGLIFFRNDEVVCFFMVEDKIDGKWIQAFEVMPKYQGHGLSKQLLDIAVKRFGATKLSVSKKNELATSIYKKYGFKTKKKDEGTLFMRLESFMEKSEEGEVNQYRVTPHDDKYQIPGEEVSYTTKNGQAILYQNGTQVDTATFGKNKLLIRCPEKGRARFIVEDCKVEEEFSIGAMLPQCGSTDGVGDLEDIDKSLGIENDLELDNEEEKKMPFNLNESTVFYLSNLVEDQLMEENAFTDMLGKVKTMIKINAQSKQTVMKLVMAEAKLKAARVQKNPSMIIKYTKEVGQRKKELTRLKNGVDVETGKAIDDFYNQLKSVTKEIDDAAWQNIADEIAESAESVDLETGDILLEAANMEEEIKPYVAKLNKKGYKVKYSCPGHDDLRRKDDVNKDGVYHGKLYTDARLVFDKDYNFPAAPKYWEFKPVEGKDYLDVVPITFNEKKGDAEKQFTTWKKNYLDSLDAWIDELTTKKEADDGVITQDDGDEKIAESTESFDDITKSTDDLYQEMMNDFDIDFSDVIGEKL